MPWNSQGGGPWGGGSGGGSGGGGRGGNGGSPWGQRPSGGGGGNRQQPDIEEMLRKSQDQVKRLMPGGFGGFKGILLILLVALGAWGATGFYRVQPDEEGIVLRFGKYVRTTGPGLNYHLPSPIESVLLPKVTRNERIEIGLRSFGESNRGGSRQDVPEESLMITGDENIIDIDFVVLYRIGNAREYLFEIRDPEGTVKAVAESVMREIIGQTPIQRALTEGRQQIEADARQKLQDLLNEYQAGIQILQVQLQSVDPPEQVVAAFNDVTQAQQDKDRLRNEADAYRNQIVPEAKGAAVKIVQQAKAYRDEVVARSEGDAARFQSVYQAYSQAKEVTAQRIYIETMEKILRNVNKVLIDGNNGGSGVVPYLPLPELQKRLKQTPPRTTTSQSGAQ